MNDHDENAWEPDALDHRLRRCLQARPRPAAIRNLAARAMRRAHAPAKGILTQKLLARQRQWTRALTAAAVVLVAVILFFGVRRAAPQLAVAFSTSDAAQVDAVASNESTASSDTTVSSDSTLPDLSAASTSESHTSALIAAAICCGAILVLALRRAFDPEPRTLEAWSLALTSAPPV